MDKSFFVDNNIKYTNQRFELFKYCYKEGIFSLKNLCNEFSNIDKSTIYRTINLLLEKKILEKEVLNNKIYYQFSNNHNHYLICKECEKKIIMSDCPFEYIKTTDFKITSHSLVVEGICKKCEMNCK